MFLATPKRNKITGAINYFIGRRFNRRKGVLDSVAEANNPATMLDIGIIQYGNGSVSSLQVPSEGPAVYQVNIVNRPAVDGLQIQSHRPVYSYAAVGTIPAQAMTREQYYNQYFQISLQRYLGQQNPKSPLLIIKESLISLALFGYGNQYVTGNNNAREMFDGFQEVLRAVLPSKIGFKKLSIEVPEVLLETESGDFSIDAMSGGVSSIVDIAWRIFNFAPPGKPFVCIIDEPENHLHPELQQSLLPNLIQAFPHVQFIIATHSPFMISAAYDSTVYALDYNDERKVICKKLDTVDKAGTANEILRDVLGLPFTMPLWAESKAEEILQKYADVGMDDTMLDQLEAELAEAGLGNLIPPPLT